MAYNIFIDNAISYGYIKADALRAESLMSNDFIQEDVHSNHGNETLVGQNQTHIIAGALRNLSANYNDASEKYGAMFIKIGQGNFNLSNIAGDPTWGKFVDGMASDEGTNFTRIYVKNDDGYAKVSSIDELTADDNTKLDESSLANHEYVLVYGYEFIRRNGRNSIKVPMMPNLYSVFTDGNVHVMVNDGQEGWDTTDRQMSSDDIFENGDVTTPTDYYGEFKSRVDLDGWIKEQTVDGRTLIRKWNTENDKAGAKTGNVAGDYSIMGKDNTHNELFIWFDEVSGNIYLGTATNAVFVEGTYETDDNNNKYVPATGGNATITVQPEDFHTFDVVAGENGNTLGEGQITFDNEDGDESDPTITNVERDAETGEIVITLGGIEDLNQSDVLPLINVAARPTVLKGIAEYHTFDPFSGEDNPSISDITYVDGIFNTDGYTKADLDALIADGNKPTPTEEIEINDETYVYFGLSKGDVATDGSEIDDTAAFDFTDEETINLIKVNDAEVTYHLYYVPESMFRAEVTLTNVHEYTQAGPTDETMYLNNGNVEQIPGVD